MASVNNKTKTDRKTGRTDGENTRWVIGLLLLCIGLFAVASVLFYFSHWKADYSVLHELDSKDPRVDGTFDNLCGFLGAWLAEQIIGRSFGLFGIILPVLVIAAGVRVIRRRALIVNHLLLSGLLVLILGSLTLGFLFTDRWGIFNSGWGGAYGIEIAALLVRTIGKVGTAILLLGGWILTGVFINRNFINTVNRAGQAVVEGSGKILTSVTHKIVHAQQDTQQNTQEPSQPDEALPDDGHRPQQAAPYPEPEAAPRSEAAFRSEATFRSEAAPRSEVASRPEPEPEADLAEVDGTPASPAPEPAYDQTPREVRIEDLDIELQRMEQQTLAARDAGRPLHGSDADDDNPFVEFSMNPTVEPAAGAGALGADAAVPDPCEDPDGEPAERLSDDGIFTEIDLSPERRREHEDKAPTGLRPEGADAVAGDEAAVREKPSDGIVVTVEEHRARLLDEREIPTTLYDPLKDLEYYAKPSPGLLENYPSDTRVSDREIFENKTKIENALRNFGIPIQRIHATSGPTVTLYEIVQAEGVRISKIQGLENDIAQSLKALGIRIIAPIPGKGTIGIEVPNINKQIVSMYSSICSPEFQNCKAELPVVIGRTIQNQNYVFDLAKMPHLLVAGATGQGKSVGLNAIITSLLYTKHPAQLKFVMIDPKMVEFSLYAKIEKHFLAKMESEEDAIITDPKKAVYTLNSLCSEMDTRLDLCRRAGARNIAEYNEKFVNRRLNPHNGHRYLPYIVVVVDEFADLIMTAREVEGPVMRLAQKARAIGIHLIIATQRPDVKVITGGIKANFPARIAFRVMQMIDSRTIIDQPGANQLIGRGDMLFSKDGELTRIQCSLVETKEVERVVEYISRQQGYTSAYNLPDYTPESSGEGAVGSEESGKAVKYDALFAEIARAAVSQNQISTSSIQRNYEVGFNRAGRIMMQLQRAGIVGPQDGAKPRDILYHDLPSLEARLQDLGVF